tara:strand:- start:591 stop:956 length:366 start_codon:yes stop_codon:yes gene_type:complete
MGVSMWTLFFIAGLPSHYFLRWDWGAQLIVIVLMPTWILWSITRRRIVKLEREAAHSRILWTAFYFTLPFLLLDIAYLGLYQNRGVNFLVTHWYLTAFYITPWIFLPTLMPAKRNRLASKN